MQSTSDFEHELTEFLIHTLSLEEMAASEIDPAMNLFGDGLGLDSIDALELGMAIQKKYGVAIDAKDKNTREHFRSIRTLARFIADTRGAL